MVVAKAAVNYMGDSFTQWENYPEVCQNVTVIKFAAFVDKTREILKNPAHLQEVINDFKKYGGLHPLDRSNASSPMISSTNSSP